MAENRYVGKRCTRPDSLAKVLGAAKYTADLVVSRKDVLHAKAVFAPYGHAHIISIDTSKAAACGSSSFGPQENNTPTAKRKLDIWLLFNFIFYFDRPSFQPGFCERAPLVI